MDSLFEDFERKQEIELTAAKEAVKPESSVDSSGLNRKEAADTARILAFSDPDDFGDSCEDDDFDKQPVVNRVHIKDQPPKFGGKGQDFVSWSQEFTCFAVHF